MHASPRIFCVGVALHFIKLDCTPLNHSLTLHLIFFLLVFIPPHKLNCKSYNLF